MNRIIIENGKYEIGDGLGCWAKSSEVVTVTEGDVRLIGGILMFAYHVERSPWYKITGDCRDVVNWTPVDNTFNTYENLRSWKRAILDR